LAFRGIQLDINGRVNSRNHADRDVEEFSNKVRLPVVSALKVQGVKLGHNEESEVGDDELARQGLETLDEAGI